MAKKYNHDKQQARSSSKEKSERPSSWESQSRLPKNSPNPEENRTFTKYTGPKKKKSDDDNRRPRFEPKDGERRPYNSDNKRPFNKPADGKRWEGRTDKPSERPRFESKDGERRPFDPDKKRPFTKRSDDSRSFDKPSGFKKRDERGTPREDFRKTPDRKEVRDNQAGVKRRPRYSESILKAKLPPKVRDKVEAKESKHTDGTIRLNRFIANAGVCSRRDADELILNGEVAVNGKVVTEMGARVLPTDKVVFKGKLLERENFVYVLLNKPKDYLTTTDDPNERKTVMELVAEAGTERIYPVGRLDRKTTGLLLLTNDGKLAEKLSHPSNSIEKIYQAEIDKPITEEDFDTLRKGVDLEDGFIKPDEVALITPDAEVVGIKIHSGKNRVVRRIFEHLGYEVTKLDRTIYAGLTKKELPRGKWRFLTEKEVIKLKYLN